MRHQYNDVVRTSSTHLLQFADVKQLSEVIRLMTRNALRVCLCKNLAKRLRGF